MKALYLLEKDKFEMRDIPIPKPKDHEVLIRVKSCGICGSDVHYWEYGKIGDFVVTEPLILGHEFSGEIVECGKDVTGLKVGDLVVVEPGEVCGKCEACKKGRYNLCPDMAFFATPPYDGSFCEYVAFSEKWVYKVPQGMDSELAALVEPLAVGVFSTMNAGVKLGERAIVYGAGVIGLGCMIAAKAAGATEVVMVDVREDRLAFAKSLGADDVINAKVGTDKYNGYFDIAYECSGAVPSLLDAVDKLKWGGRVAAVGINVESTQTAPISTMIIREIKFMPTFRYANAFEPALEIIAKDKETFAKMITDRYTFDQAEEAFKTARDSQNAVKVMVNFY